MLSYILGITFRYERIHGFLPNLVYISRRHVQNLYIETGALNQVDLSRCLGLKVVIYPGIDYPQVYRIFRAF